MMHNVCRTYYANKCRQGKSLFQITKFILAISAYFKSELIFILCISFNFASVSGNNRFGHRR